MYCRDTERSFSTRGEQGARSPGEATSSLQTEPLCQLVGPPEGGVGDGEVAAAGDVKLAQPERWSHDLEREERQH